MSKEEKKEDKQEEGKQEETKAKAKGAPKKIVTEIVVNDVKNIDLGKDKIVNMAIGYSTKLAALGQVRVPADCQKGDVLEVTATVVKK